jgi:hypothetical protein
VVGKDTPFAILDDARVGTYLAAIEGDERAPAAQDDALVWQCVYFYSLKFFIYFRLLVGTMIFLHLHLVEIQNHK